jgi:Tfp pilus assembly protein PilF
MSNARWQFQLFAAGLLSIGGCGSSAPSTEKSYDHFVAAAKALETGDKETALTELSATIEKAPSDWAYFERARLLAESGREQEAAADVQKGLELAPQNANLKWLDAELKKPADKRFQGKFAQPPGLRKNQR